MKCHYCGAETSNGLALCDLCRRADSINLEFVPVYFGNLSRWRPGRGGSRSVPGSREPSGMSTMSSDRVSNALDEAGAMLTQYAVRLASDRCIKSPVDQDDEAATMAVVCRWLNEHLTSISLLPWCGDFTSDLAIAERQLRGLTMTVVPGWYAGACQQCGCATYVVPGLTWVTCRHLVPRVGEDGKRRMVDIGCGTTTYARDHLETILEEARGWVAPPMRMAEALVALIDTEQSVPRLHKRISKWGEREEVDVVRRTDADGDPVGPKRFRLGQVLDRLLAEGATRPDSDSPSPAVRSA